MKNRTRPAIAAIFFSCACSLGQLKAAVDPVVTIGSQTHQILPGDLIPYAQAFDTSVITMLGGEIHSTGPIYAGLEAGALAAGTAQFNMHDGTINTGVAITESASFNMTGGAISSLQLDGSAAAYISGGSAQYIHHLYTDPTSPKPSLHISGGTHGTISTLSATAIQIENTSVEQISLSYADSFIVKETTLGNASAWTTHDFGGQTVMVENTDINGEFWPSANHLTLNNVNATQGIYIYADEMQVDLRGGTVPNTTIVQGNVTFHMTTGNFQNNRFGTTLGTNHILEGTSFSYTGGEIDFNGETELVLSKGHPLLSQGEVLLEDLTVTWLDGTSMTADYFVYLNGLSDPNFAYDLWSGSLTLRLIPAPSSLALLVPVILPLTYRRRPIA